MTLQNDVDNALLYLLRLREDNITSILLADFLEETGLDKERFGLVYTTPPNLMNLWGTTGDERITLTEQGVYRAREVEARREAEANPDYPAKWTQWVRRNRYAAIAYCAITVLGIVGGTLYLICQLFAYFSAPATK